MSFENVFQLINRTAFLNKFGRAGGTEAGWKESKWDGTSLELNVCTKENQTEWTNKRMNSTGADV